MTRLLPADKARIGSFAARIQVDPQDFTSDQREMLVILRTELQPDGPTPLWNAVKVGDERAPTAGRAAGRRWCSPTASTAPMNFSSNNVSLKDAIEAGAGRGRHGLRHRPRRARAVWQSPRAGGRRGREDFGGSAT